MTLEFELYEEKRRKLRRSSFFKGSLVTLIILTIAWAILNRDIISYPHIAKFEVSGEIYDDYDRHIILSEIAADDNVYGVIVQINSPGGSLVGAESLYESLKTISEKKPVVVSIGEVGASAAYLAALAADRIFARANSLVGSIGVIVQYPDLSRLAEILGVSMKVIKSGEAKGGPNFFEPIDESVISNQETLVNDGFTWFKDIVARRRKLSGIDLDMVSSGELFTGRMALKLGLIDAIGSSDNAIKYFHSLGDKFHGLTIRNWSLRQKSNSIWNNFFGLGNSVLGKGTIKFKQSPMLFSIAG